MGYTSGLDDRFRMTAVIVGRVHMPLIERVCRRSGKRLVRITRSDGISEGPDGPMVSAVNCQ